MRVVIGEDEALVRTGLAHILEHHGFEVAGTAADAARLWALVTSVRPDLLVTDIRMPPGNADDGLRIALRTRVELPATAVVVLSQHMQRSYAVELLDGGSNGVGYLLKQRISDIGGFCADLRRVAAGGTALDREVVALMVARAQRAGGGIDLLTGRQREVLALMAQGLSNAEIARRLLITEKAVVAHVSHLYDGLGLTLDDVGHRRVQAVVAYLNR